VATQRTQKLDSGRDRHRVERSYNNFGARAFAMSIF
jgi:hypothetical protein